MEFHDPIINFVQMNKAVFEKLKEESRQAQRTENVGMLIGKQFDDRVIVTDIVRFDYDVMQRDEEYEKMSLWKKVIGAGSGGTLVGNLKVLQAVSSTPNVIGFYHTHPTRDRISPADKREMLELIKTPQLAKPSALHIICRKGGLVPWGSWTPFEPADPLAYVRRGNRIENIEIRVL